MPSLILITYKCHDDNEYDSCFGVTIGRSLSSSSYLFAISLLFDTKLIDLFIWLNPNAA